MLKQQNWKCASCKEPVKEGKGRGCAHVDHDHKTKKVRGILCAGCNVGLGHLDTIEKLAFGIEYRKRTS